MLRRFFREKSGNFGLVAALSMVPIIAAVGASVDYSMALSVRSQLQAAADSAAVSALAEQSVGVIAALANGSTGTLTVAQKDADAWFKANLDQKTSSYLKSYTITVQKTGNEFTSEVRFNATVPTSFLAIINKYNIDVAGVAKGSYVPVTYTDFYLMLDNSPSMGLGATDADISKLEANNDGCAFACHIEGSTTDAYSLAKKLGVTTRIQLVASATQAMIATAKSTRKYADQYRMALFSMGDKATSAALTTVAAMSADLDSIKTKAGTIDLMSIPYQNYNNDQMTDLLTNLTSLKTTIGRGGEGLSASDRQKVLFLVSDGVEDASRSTGCLKKLSGSTRCQAPLDFSICNKIKDQGVRIAVLYTTYQPIESNSWYTTWIKPFRREIASNMQSCASSGLYFEVSPSQGITEAMNALFLKVINYPRLTM